MNENELTTKPQPQRQENMLLNIVLNIVIPTVILIKFSGEEHLGARNGIIVALAFPILYGLREFWLTRKLNFFSALGVLSILLTGGISLLELDPKYIAIKEAAIPGLFGIATLLSLKTRYPLVKTFLYNDKILRVDLINEALSQNDTLDLFEKALFNASLMIAGSFFLSSVLNFTLAKVLLVSAPGTEAFNAELGAMTAWSFPVITIPTMLILVVALFYLLRSIKRHTGLALDDVFQEAPKKNQG